MSDNIKVVVKVRPLIPRELEDNFFYQWRVENDTLYQIDQNERPVGQSFTFDKVYDKHTKTSDVYKDVAKPIVEAATAGFNGTIFAYGQTSSGKTFTMTGSDESPGIIQLAVLDLFEIIQNIPNRDFLVRVSYVEIYNETLTDLLCMEKKVKIHDTIHGVKVDTTEEVTSSPEEILDVMRKGKANRQTAATNMNEESSRSHSIFQITIESREHIEHDKDSGCVHVSQLNLVDLAGSERAGQTGATGLRFKEGTAINKSLSSLALVIKQLSEDPNKHVNYRDSKLTRILQNSLGGNAKTSIICAVTPAAIEETISTLQFANRAKAIKNKPAVNAVATDATMIQKLTKQLSFLKTELESKKNVEKYNNDLQKKIGSLQRLILNGFGRRNTADILNPRRKLVQPRRMTISTLQSIQEDPAPDIPKFCTPSLKYNPLVLPGVPDFQPLSSATSLPALHEEPARARTPPRPPPAPFAPDEVIDLDSDDDCTPEPQTCPTSPYHNCFESSKTPPCILKRTARRAEKNLKDIVELTGREKLFEPSVVELMEKLEHNATVVLNLEDEINKLNIKSKEKDFEMEKLKSKLCKFEDEMKMLILAKVDLESRCKEYNTKLTDSEVSYETLKKKAKSREAELLSLLEEQVPKKPEIIGQLSTDENTSDKLTNLSVAERKISNDDRETSNPANTEEIDLQGQLTIKDAKILELEEIIAKYLQEIVSLEKNSEESQYKLNSFSENITRVEDELLQYKATVDNLNKIIEGQKENIEIFKAEIESYKTQLHEQQNKFQKEELLNINISERELQDLITSEETFLANNENMNNLIKSFKLVLVSKNNEIKILRTELEKYDTHTDANMKMESDLSNKNNEIANLTEEIENLKSQLVDKGSKISKIGLEQNNLEKSVIHLTNQNEQLLIQSTELKALNEKLGEEILNKDQEFALVSGNYLKQIEDQALKIESLENELLAKNNTIISLEKAQQKTQEHFNEAKSALCKIQSIMEILTGNIKNVPDVIDNFVIFYKTLCHDLSTLESIAQEIKSQKMQFIDLIKKFQNQYAMLEREIDMTIDTLNNYENISDVGQERFAMKGEQSVLNNVDLIPNKKMQENINLRNSAFEKLHLKIENILKMLQTNQPLYLETIKAKDCEIADLKVNVSNSKIEIESKDKELLLLQQEIDKEVQKRDQLLINILNISTDLTLKLDMDNNISLELKNIPDEVYERIIYMLNKTSEHIEMLYSKIENNDLALMLLKAKKEIQELTEINRKYMEDISHMESTNYNLSGELDKIRQENSVLAKDLNESSKVLNTLQQELKTKLNELENIQDKAREWKTQFINLDFIMKEQMHALHIDNEKLQKRSSELVNKNREQRDMVNCSNVNVPLLSSESDNDFKSPQSLLTLCCNIIIDSIQPNDKPTSISASSVRSNTPIHETNIQRRPCRCDKLELKLKEMFEEKKYLKSTIEELKISNKVLKKEHSVVQEEVKSLLDVTYELHKRVINHRTNLSTLTAMTFAENKSLSSQNKFLQHHHHRLHHLCQRDIPAFKQQLQELMMLLKSESRMPKDSLKRFSTTNFLCNTSQLSNIKDESALDADLLMLDTNVTLTTTGDTTLVNHDQTCFDVTQICTGSEVACQTADFATVIDPILFNSQIYENPNTNYRYMETLDELKTENSKLRDMVNDYYAMKKSDDIKLVCTSPIKNENQQKQELELPSKKLTDLESEKACILDKYTNILKDSASTETLEKKLKTLEKQYSDELIKQKTIKEKYLQEIEQLTLKLSDVESEKDSILDKYNNLMLEIPSTDMLVKKLTTTEKEYNSELEKLKTLLKNKNEKIADLQEENDSLSTQVMEIISEVDDLKKVQEDLKAHKAELTEKCLHLQIEVETVKSKYHNSKSFSCPDCKSKDKLISSLKLKMSAESHSMLSRSYSDSDRTSRYNTICTLQSELHAGKEDCNTLKEEVTTIKNHLYRSNLSMDQPMDLDDSMGEPNLFNYAKDCNMPGIAEKRPLDTYAVDKAECFNYYVEITGANKEDICNDIKIIDIMKMLYDNVVVKHGNEVENLINKLRDCADCKTQLELQIGNITKEYSCKTKELDEKTRELETIEKLTFHIKYQISQILNNSTNFDDIASFFRETILKPLDTQFDLNSSLIYDSIISKLVSNLNEKTIQCSKLEDDIRNIQGMLTDVKNNLTDLTSQLTEKENEYNLLAKENERIQEICKALTLDIVKKEQDLDKIITEGCRKLSHHDILEQGDINSISPVAKNIDSVFDLIIKQFTIKNRLNVDEQNYNLIQEVTNMKTAMAVKHVELQTLTESLQGKESELQIQKSLFDDLNKIYEKKVDENSTNIAIINKMNEEINVLKETLQSKEVEMKSLQDNNLGVEKHNGSLEDKTKELIHMKEHLEQELGNLKAINDKISKENDTYATHLEKSSNTIKSNKIELEALISEVDKLKETVKQNLTVIEKLKEEVKCLFEENTQLKEQLQEKVNDCSRLEINIKTHEKTSEIQSRMIKRLQKQKDVDDEKDKQMEELKRSYSELEKERDALILDMKASAEELQHLNNAKQLLQAQVSELQDARRPRLSLDALGEGSRRRRQSIHDSNRMFAEDRNIDDCSRMEGSIGSRSKNDVSLMDVDDVDSNRSTPLRLSKGRDSSQGKLYQSDREEEAASRPSSVLAARRRRQSVYDLHRSALSQSPSPHDHPRKLLPDLEKSEALPGESELSEMRKQLASCQDELEELREKYKELDDECETCAQYLRERDEQCLRLKREKLALEQEIADLKLQLPSCLNKSGQRNNFSDAAVNTDEDWTNLHSVVVDRMSYNAEVEKNKKLTKTIEELRFHKQDLKATMAKMQNALDKRSGHDNRVLEMTKSELHSCKQELGELKERYKGLEERYKELKERYKELEERYKELDEECETCAEYLRERDEQCRKLKEAKIALEARLADHEADAGAVAQSVRKKRQTLHDQNRDSTTADLVDASTETNEDLQTYQVEKDTSNSKPDEAKIKEIKRLRYLVEKLMQQKAALEQRLAVAGAAHAPLLVASGSAIVQNQQLTDLMKENQKLKKINTKLIQICKKRNKTLSENRENQDPSDMHD